jgi:hypothetical protein
MQALTFLTWISVTAVGAWLKPNPHGHGTHQQLGMPPCPSVMLFDRPCPGCGLTTSFSATIHGDLPLAFAAHPLGPIAYLAFTGIAWIAIALFFRGQRFDTDSPVFQRLFVGFVVVVFVFGIVRWITMPGYGVAHERVLQSTLR